MVAVIVVPPNSERITPNCGIVMPTNNTRADVHVLSKQRLTEKSATKQQHVLSSTPAFNSSDKMQTGDILFVLMLSAEPSVQKCILCKIQK